MIVVSDTSVITALLQVGRHGLLQDLYETVLIPEAVHRELNRSHPALPGFLEVRAAANRAKVARLTADLDLGEAEAIVLALESKADLLLIDEKLGRLAALREGLAITGLMGVLVAAKRKNRISSMRELVGQIEIEAGFRVSEAVKREAFRAAGE
jgi:predicted nucleic acid-binding protein